jgi:hypothetical protein
MMLAIRRLAAAGFVAAMAMGATTASAVTLSFVETRSGNDCAGVLGIPFGTCSYDGSAIVAKVGEDGNDALELNTSVFGNAVSNTTFAATVGSNTTSFSWDTTGYSVNANGDPLGILIRYVVVKFGNGFNVYSVNGGEGSFTGSGSLTVDQGVSHVSFYDSVAVVPLPAAGWMLLAGVGGLVAVRRRKKMVA